MEQSQNSLTRLNNVVEELIGIVRKQQTEFKQALEAEKNNTLAAQTQTEELTAQIETLKNELTAAQAQNQELTTQLEATNTKIVELENASASEAGTVDEIKALLAQETQAKEEYAQKCQDSEQKLAEMQQTISQTTENIDDVVARLEKVLEENGASNNND